MAEITIYEGALDKGLEGVVACTTSVSFIVGNTLNYRGYTIEDLTTNSTFEETTFLLWNNRLPNKTELENFKAELNVNMILDPAFINVLKTLPTKNVHPMAWL
ncbi:MAG: citrate synthase, partial [Moraxellaceae bacterium]|nr:citrate synthase [Pseudobdellovibrionaceae bacterium]